MHSRGLRGLVEDVGLAGAVALDLRDLVAQGHLGQQHADPGLNRQRLVQPRAVGLPGAGAAGLGGLGWCWAAVALAAPSARTTAMAAGSKDARLATAGSGCA